MWQYIMAGCVGLDWTQVKAMAEIRELELNTDIMMRLFIIEQGRMAAQAEGNNG